VDNFCWKISNYFFFLLKKIRLSQRSGLRGLFSERGKNFDRIDFCVQGDVGVACRHINGGVSYQITHDKGIDSAVDQHTDVGMPEGVEARRETLP